MARTSLLAKRALDLGIVVLAAPVMVPVLGVLAVLVARKLGRPVFFRQTRPGRDGRLFSLVKFRTMTDARDATGALLPDEARLTAFGRWLRASSLDEWRPQRTPAPPVEATAAAAKTHLKVAPPR